ncbi:MAG: hypothetical protein WCB27_22645 [Thermoguttaceae bacterium]|jgi:hypothetical protein
MKERAEAKTNESAWRRRGRTAAWIALVVAGIVVEQFILIGPSLLGRKVLLPLDYLALPGVYLPTPPSGPQIVPHDKVYSDLVLIEGMSRKFMVSEFRAGRWPLWSPNFFCGSPFVYSAFSPFKISQYCSASPFAYAWPPFFLAIFTGLGMYFFCRRVLLIGPWPAVITAWCWPLTGFFIFWMGYGLPFSTGWLPWLLWAVNAIVRRTSPWAGFWLAVATGLTMVSGQLDTGAQVLLVSGFYAVWCFIDEYGRRCFTLQVMPALATVVVGWGLGFALASVHLLPILEYSRSSFRLERRSHGEEERPPIGMEALPQIVLPDMYGSWQEGYLWVPPRLEGNQLESPAATYAGLLATLLLVPVAWCSRRHRSINVFWLLLAVLGLSWSLDLPGFVQVLRLPGIKMLSHNRFVFATSLSLVAMMAVGLDVLWRGEVRWRWWFWGPITLAAVSFLWCAYSSVALPTGIANMIVELRREISSGAHSLEFPDLKAVDQVQSTFVLVFSVATVLCILSLGGWALIGLGVTSRRWFLPVLSALLLADLLWFAYGRVSQCDLALYYPPIPALEQVADAAPGRIIGVRCLPPMLAQSHNLRDVRGYDAVDPLRIVELLLIAADPRAGSPQYATTQSIVPKFAITPPSEIRLHPILDMLNVRYVIFRGTAPPQLRPAFSSPDYCVMENRRALPRVFVPRSVEVATDKRERLTKMAADDFDPRQVAYVEEPVELPSDCYGTAEIVDEIPTQVKVSFDMQTPGLVVLADRWDAGWHAYFERKRVPILQTDHALRGVIVPAGKGTIEFRYEPAGFAWGLRLCAMASLALTVWAAAAVWMSRPDRHAENATNSTPANDSSPARKGRG